MSSSKNYCKEISKNFNNIAIYMPGSSVKIGNIISFDKVSPKSTPTGTFTHEFSLETLNIDYKTSINNTKNDLSFSSNSVFSTTLKANIDNIANTRVSFNKKNGTFFKALSCYEEDILDFSEVKKQLHKLKDTDLDNFYIVTKVITAEKALIMQSSTKGALLEFNAKVDDATDLSLGFNIIYNTNSNFVIKSQNKVNILMTLHKFVIKHYTKTDKKVLAICKVGNKYFF